LPGCEAVIEQAPAAIIVPLSPLTVQTEVLLDVYVTASPELAVALIVTGLPPTFCVPGSGNAMVCTVVLPPPPLLAMAAPETSKTVPWLDK
jgi:hypothetical protein